MIVMATKTRAHLRQTATTSLVDPDEVVTVGAHFAEIDDGG
jgi:hypothetical protein